MLKRRFPVELLKGALGFALAILLIAPVAVLWSAGRAPSTDLKTRDAVEKYHSQPGQLPGAVYPQWAVQDEVAWKEKQAKPLYSRPAGNWDEAKLGKAKFDHVPFVDLDADDTLILPNNKGSFRTKGPKPEIAAALKKDLHGSARAKGDYFIAQLSPSSLSGKKNDQVRGIFANLGQVDVLDYIPNNAYLVRVKGNAKQALLSSGLFSYVDAYHGAFKIHPDVATGKTRSPQQAVDPVLRLRVDLHQGETSADVRRAVQQWGGVVTAEITAVDHQVLGISLDKDYLADLADLDAVKSINEKRGQQSNALVTSIQDEVGRLLDPRANNGFVRPFYAEGIDGGGLYVTDANQIAGCTPFNPVSGVVDPNCYIIPPQYVGEVDNGISLDSAPLAYNTTQGCGPPNGDCSGLPSSGVGPTNRKVEAYMKSSDFDNNGTPNDATAEGDTLSCDAINSGGDTHGHIVAATMLGNPSNGQFGLGFQFNDLDQSNQFATYFNDTNEFNLPMDGQAPGARLVFVDATGTGVAVNGPPPCATNYLSDVDTGLAVVDDVQALACRNDLAGSTTEDCVSSTNDPNEPWFRRGARDITLPFGSATDFDNNIFNGHGSYAGDASDLDTFLFLHRRVSITVPVGNDGADQTGSDIDPFAPRGDPNDTFTADDIQIQDLATAKNIMSVGSNTTDTLQRGLTATDPTEFINNFTSKGPATFASRRVAPLLIAPGFEPAKGGGGREGEYTDDYWDSHAVIVSWDDDQSTATQGMGMVRNQKKSGTSFSAAKVTGVAAQIRDYFAKGYYPTGVRTLSATKQDISGSLVKAVLSASTDFAQSGPLIASCQNKFCQSEQGYGKVELANALPLKSYPAVRRPADTSPLSNQPDVPNNILVMDELFDGGKGFGVVQLGASKEASFTVTHGGASLRAALAWYDAPGDLLVNDLNLEVVDGDFDYTEGYGLSACAVFGTCTGAACNAALGTGAGSCNFAANRCIAAAGSDITGYGCAYCKIAALPNPDAAWFDPTTNNPYVRRYLGNHFTDRQQFSKKADCDAGTGALNLASPNSLPDVRNTTEMVYLYSTTDGSNIPFVAANQGTNSEGRYKAVVSWPDSGTGREKAAPNTPCVFDGAGDGIDGAVGATDRLLSTRDGKAYIGSGVDDPNTVGTDEAACNSTAVGDDVQVCPNGGKCQPFALVVTGPIDYGTGLAQVELDKQAYDCSDTSLRMTVTEEDSAGATITEKITAGSRIEVLNSSGLVVDSEAGIAFAPINAGASTFRIWRRMGNVSAATRVQYIGDLGRGPILNNGIVEVQDGQSIRAVYQDPNNIGDPTAIALSKVQCKPLVGNAYIGLAIENFKQHVIAGGCDIGRAVTLRGDFNMDAKERLQYQVYFTNHGSAELVDLLAHLTCINPTGTTQNPCQYITITDPDQHIGRLPYGMAGAALFNIVVRSDVATLSTANRVVELKTTFVANSTDSGGTLGTQSFTYRAALQADNQRLFYSTDKPEGGLVVVDYNQNGQIETAELNNGGRREEREVRTYQSWAGTLNNKLVSTTIDPNGLCGTAGCVPFNFDSNDGSFTTRMSADSKPGAGYPSGNQGWGYSTSGACGWQTRNGSSKGTWHGGETDLLGSGTCGSYAIPSDPFTLPLVERTNHLLTSPVFNKVNQGTDARGFSFDARMENLAWNENMAVADSRTTPTIEIDTNIDDDGPSILGDTYTYRAPFALSATLMTYLQGARHFGPQFSNGTPDPNDDFGVSAPLATYDAGDIFQRPFMAYPAADADPNTGGFQSDVSLCGGLSCRPGGFTTPAGPVRNRDIDTGASFEDFNGASGNRFQVQFNWVVREGGTAAAGWTIDDLVFEWSEQHPADAATFAGGDCSLNNTSLPFQGTCVVNTCSGGPRNGLFCRSGRNDDCRTVAVEGTCTSLVCTTGRVGIACTDQNDCDLGSCVAGNTALGCSVEADCNLNTNDCDAIPFRISPVTPVGASALARQCATINFERLFSYDCTSGLEVTVQDDTPSVSGIAVAGVCTSLFCSAGKANTHACTVNSNCDVRQVTVTARSGQEPLGENFKLTESLTVDGLFNGTVSASSVQDQPGVLFLDSDPGQRFTLIVSYPDPECDLDRDGQVGETAFTDLDGDGTPNFGLDGVLKDQDPIKKFCSLPIGGCFPGSPVSDDDNCFDNLTTTDVFNPVATAQMDLNDDGFINASDCVDDPNHNRSHQCDWDSDGIGDICDNCPKTSNSDQLDTDNDGIGNQCEDNDIDRDGVGNVADNCPTIYNPGQATTAAGKGGGSRFNHGIYCDDQPPSLADFDGDGFTNLSDNCPNENSAEGVLPPTAAATYNPDQRDTDGDGIGDKCESEDFDHDNVVNPLDNCGTVYNPADPTFTFQTDSDGDALGDDRNGKDSVGRCVGGPTPGKQCLPVNTGANCGVGGFCVQSADAYCDPDSKDDNSNGVPDDLTQFTTELDCNYGAGSFGAAASEVAAVGLSAAVLTDDGKADFVCISGDPDPNNLILTEDCPDHNPANRAASIGVTGTAADLSCQTPGSPVPTPNCEPVPDGTADPKELVSVRVTLSNQTPTSTATPRTLTNTTIGLRANTNAIGCVTKGQVFVGTFAGGGTLTTPANGLQFILSPTTGQSTPEKFAEVNMTVTVLADGIEANSPDMVFSAGADRDLILFPPITNGCGVGGALGAAHNVAGALCEDFDTERNGVAGYQFTRLFLTADPNDALRGVPDPNDDTLGHTVDGGPVPFGVDGRGPCSSDPGAAPALTCHVVPTENDWHLHSAFEPCGGTYDNIGLFPSSCAPEPRAHSGFRSMHMGRHLNVSNTLFDTYRFRQTSAFVMDPFEVGDTSTLNFWQIIQVCDDKCVNAGAGGTCAGGQVQISLLDNASNKYEKWRRLAATVNGYNSVDQEVIIICEFDPGDDQLPPLDETMCGSQPQWSDMGDVYGSDRTCTVDQDGSDPVDKDCGSTTNRTALGTCNWVTNPTCGSFLENGNVGRGVWARSSFNLSSFLGRRARLRWIFEGGGGWGFGTSRSFIEPSSGSPYFAYDQDDGWYIDDIRVTDARQQKGSIQPDPDDGLTSCPSQGDTANCGTITVNITGSAVDVTAGDTVLFAQNANVGAQVLLDARQSVADAGAGCLSGILEYRWVQLSDHNGSVVNTLQDYSPDATASTAVLGDATYRVDVRCTSDSTCTASKEVSVLAYTGDAVDIGSEVASYSPIGILDGIYVEHDRATDTATISWRARPQPPGVSGYDLFRRTQTAIGAAVLNGAGDPFATDKFQGTCLTNAIAQTAAGTRTTTTNVASTLPAGQAWLYMVGHSSNNTLAIAPLGRRPSTSNRAGTLMSANVPCP